ncbi:hypothetical protein FCOIX_2651 [Fusarium coicis]|nr:hypothetical protein FCOIX_2651 [Fusarium coicis]
MADPNESSQFLLQPLNFDTSSSPAPSTGYDMAQSEISDGRWDEATSATSGCHGHVEAITGCDDERRTEACTTISESMNALAMRLTTEFRRAGLDAYGNATAVVEGQGWENRSCLRVAWE